MSTSKRMRMLSARKYAIFYPEGSGYIHLEQLNEGTQGSVALVLSCADHQVYIRKRGNLIDYDPEAYPIDYGCDEVFFYRKHNLIPKLVDWIIYRPLTRDHPSYYEYCSTSTIWEFCSYGDLRGLIDAYNSLNSQYGHNSTIFPYKFPVPEALIWKVFGQLIQTVAFLHHARPPIAHMDIFVGNVFLRRSANSELPDCCLGDFGKSFILSADAWNSQGRLTRRRTLSAKSNPAQFIVRDYRTIILIVKQLMTLDYGFGSQESESQNIEKHNKLFEDLELAHTGRSAGSPVPGDTDSLSDFPIDSRRETYQSSTEDGYYRYTPLLFDTIRQLEDRLRAVVDLSRGMTREVASNRDWSYIGEAMEKKAADRMGIPMAVDYPPVDDRFKTQLNLIEMDFTQDDLRRSALYDREDIKKAIERKDPVGPFRIARLDRSTLALIGVSRKTYNTFDVEHSKDIQGDGIGRDRGDFERSAAYDPVQVDNVPITRTLDYGNLN